MRNISKIELIFITSNTIKRLEIKEQINDQVIIISKWIKCGFSKRSTTDESELNDSLYNSIQLIKIFLYKRTETYYLRHRSNTLNENSNIKKTKLSD